MKNKHAIPTTGDIEKDVLECFPLAVEKHLRDGGSLRDGGRRCFRPSSHGLKQFMKDWKSEKSLLYEHFPLDGRLYLSAEEEGEPPSLGDVRMGRSYAFDFLKGKIVRDNILNQDTMEQSENICSRFWKWFADRIDKCAPKELQNNKHDATGMKLSKKLKKEFEESWMGDNTEKLSELLQVALSKVTEALKGKGIVCLSVHPIDILLQSTFTSSWSSCHTLGHEYGAGPVSLALDTVTAVAFSYGNSWIDLGDGWSYPEKKWRQLVFFDMMRGSAIMGRVYPGQDSVAEKLTRKLAAKVLASYHGVEAKWYAKTLYGHAGTNGRDEDSEDEEGQLDPVIEFSAVSSWQYDGDAPTYRIKLKQLKDGSKGKNPVCNYGIDIIPCLDCGDDRYDPDRDRSLLVCTDCAGLETCHHCDRDFPDEDITHNNGEPLCIECTERFYFRCDACGELHHEDNGREYLWNGGELCNHCAEDMISDDNLERCDRCGDLFGDGHSGAYTNHDLGAYFCPNCSRETTFVCEECDEWLPNREALPDDDSRCEDCGPREEGEEEEHEVEEAELDANWFNPPRGHGRITATQAMLNWGGLQNALERQIREDIRRMTLR